MENDYELIERYFRNELNAVEKKAFTERLLEDPDFKDKFETENIIVKGVQLLSIKNSLTENDTLVSGIYVQHKAGGPKMIVKGFLNQSLDIKQFNISGSRLYYKEEEGRYNSHPILWQKVIYNRHQKMLKEFFVKSNSLVGIDNFIFFENILDDNYGYFRNYGSAGMVGQNTNATSSYCFVLCQRWSERQEDYILEIFNLNELVVVKE